MMWPVSLASPHNLTQPILPGWSFAGVNVTYAGNPSVERDVVEKVASFGKQLGILTEAVLMLADNKLDRKGVKPLPLDKDPVVRLRDIADAVEKLKEQHKSLLLSQARDAMDRLAQSDPATASYVASKYADGATDR